MLAVECTKPYSENGECLDSVMLQNILVYTTFSSSVVLLVDPTQAQELQLLAQSGTVTFALRNPKDSSTLGKNRMTPEEVAGNFGYN